MLRRSLVLMGLFFAVACVPIGVWACYGYGGLDRRELPLLIADVGDLVQANASEAELSPDEVRLVRALRRRGQDAVDALIKRHESWGTRLGEQKKPEILNRLDDIIDQVAGQRFARHSKLYWHTSLRAAQIESQKTGRPIVSLRMLGRLNEDFSCANSRFFRTTLYPEPNISKQLRQRFVLHWEPVRDVPKVTIDFGDGRKLVRPLTGNSVHLVLDASGQPIDALPGLVSAPEFAKWLAEVSALWKKLDPMDATKNWSSVVSYHRDRAKRTRAASSIAIKKSQPVADLNPTDRQWIEAANQYLGRSPSFRATTLVLQQLPARAALPIAPLKSVAEMPLLNMVNSVNRTIAEDTAFNLLALQPKIDDWFTESKETGSLMYVPLTNRIYAEVFLMPLTDPWLGLSPDDQYVALPNAGRIVAPVNTAPKNVAQQQIANR